MGGQRGQAWLVAFGVLVLVSVSTIGVFTPITAGSGDSQYNQGIPHELGTNNGHSAYTEIQSSREASQPAISANIRRKSHYKVESELNLDIPQSASTVYIAIPNGTITESHGLQYTEEQRIYEWDGDSNSPSITYEIDVRNWQSSDFHGQEYAAGDDWIFTPVMPVVIAWGSDRTRETYTWKPFIHRDRGTITVNTDSSGFVGSNYLYLGQYTEYSRMVNDQRIRLIVAEPATLAESPDEIVRSIEDASDYMTGTVHDEIVAFALPDPMRTGGAAYSQTGEFWVHADSRLDQPDNTWLHEYTHTRQTYQVNSEMEWFVEASASYHAAAITAEQGRISGDILYDFLSDDKYNDQILSEPSTWSEAQTPYRKGVKVLFALDGEIREATDDEKWLGNVVYQMHLHEGTITYSDFRQMIVEIGGSELGNWLDDYVTSSSSPDITENYGPSPDGESGGGTSTGAGSETTSPDVDNQDANTEPNPDNDDIPFGFGIWNIIIGGIAGYWVWNDSEKQGGEKGFYFGILISLLVVASYLLGVVGIASYWYWRRSNPADNLDETNTI